MLGDNGAETAGIAPPPKLPANEPKLGAEKSGLLRLRAAGPIFCSMYGPVFGLLPCLHRLGAGQSQTKLETVRSVYSACSLGAGGLVTLASLVTAHLLSLDRVTHYHSHNSRDQLMMSVQWRTYSL